MTSLEAVLVEVGSAVFLVGLIHLAWSTHQRLAAVGAEKETTEQAPWTPPPPPPGFSVLPWDP
jgi:hypothetical protein